MQTRFATNHVCLIGFRIGATLAFKAAMQSSRVKYLIFWEPVLHGGEYLVEVAGMQLNFCKHLKCKTERSVEDPSLPQEVLGFPLTSELIKDVRAINLTMAELPVECRTLTIFNRPAHEANIEKGSAVSPQSGRHLVEYIVDHQLWKEELFKRLIPVNTLDAIVSWVESTMP
jgi:hypothetical protein